MSTVGEADKQTCSSFIPDAVRCRAVPHDAAKHRNIKASLVKASVRRRAAPYRIRYER